MEDADIRTALDRLERGQHDLWDEVADVRDEQHEQARKTDAIYAVLAVSRFLVPVMIAAAGIVVGVMTR